MLPRLLSPRLLALSLLALVTLDVAHAERPRVERLVPDEILDSLATSDQLSPAALAELTGKAIEEMKSIEADVERIGGKDPDCVKAPRQVVATLRSLAEKAQANVGTSMAQGNRALAGSAFRKVMVALARAREVHGRVVSCAADEGNLNGDVSLSVEYLGEGDDQETFSDTLDLFDVNGNALDVVDVETDAGDAPPEASPFI